MRGQFSPVSKRTLTPGALWRRPRTANGDVNQMPPIHLRPIHKYWGMTAAISVRLGPHTPHNKPSARMASSHLLRRRLLATSGNIAHGTRLGLTVPDQRSEFSKYVNSIRTHPNRI
jgi:hypothetical protein